MKISIVIDAFTQGGAQKVLLALVPEWVDQGHKVQLILVQNSNSELDLQPLIRLGVQLERVSSKSALDFFALIRILGILVAYKPKVLQCHLYWSQIWGGILKMAFPRCELVWVEHNMYFKRTSLQWMLYRMFGRFTKEIIAVSVEVAEFLHSKNVKKIRFVPNPVSNAFCINNEIHRENIIVFVGRFNEQKNPSLAISAFELALASYAIPQDSKLLMVGEGPLKPELIAYVNSKKFGHKVLFSGFLREHELADLLKQARVLISSSRHEGCPLVRIEAAASGCAIVTTATGGIKGILSRDVEGVDLFAGVFVVESDADALSTALSEAFSPELWTSQRVAERSNAMSNFHPELIALAYIKSFVQRSH